MNDCPCYDYSSETEVHNLLVKQKQNVNIIYECTAYSAYNIAACNMCRWTEWWMWFSCFSRYTYE